MSRVGGGIEATYGTNPMLKKENTGPRQDAPPDMTDKMDDGLATRTVDKIEPPAPPIPDVHGAQLAYHPPGQQTVLEIISECLAKLSIHPDCKIAMCGRTGVPRVTPGSEAGSQGWPECPLNSQHMFELRFAYRDTVTPQLANVVTVPQSAGTTKFDHKWGKLVSEQTEAAKRTAPKSPAADGAFQRQYGHLIQKRENAEKVPV